MSKGIVSLSIMLISVITPAQAQFPRGTDFRVEVHGQPAKPGGAFSLHLLDMVHHNEVGQADSDAFGQASFRAIPAGEYMLQVRDQGGELIREEFVRIGSGNQSVVQINTPIRSEQPRPTGERVSVRQLRNPPSKAAFHAFVEAQRCSEAGQTDKAATALEKAIRLSPDYADAYTNLAAQHLKRGQYQKAIESAERAMQIGGPNITDLSNRALAEWALGRLDDAMRSAQQALRLDARAVTAHYVVGTLLSMDPATREEGIRHLEIAAEKLAAATKNLDRARRWMAGM